MSALGLTRSSRPSSILVVGASGGTGRHLVLDALARGHHVRAWSRTPHELPLLHERLEHVAGDVRDLALASDAVRGMTAVVSALGSQEGLKATDVCETGTRVLVEAMKRERVSRLVAITSLGTTNKLGPVHEHLLEPLVLRGIYGDKRRQEAIVQSSGLAFTILRPGRLTDARDARRVALVLDGPLPGVLVSRAALARCALDQATSDRLVGLAAYVVERALVPWHKILTLGRDAA